MKILVTGGAGYIGSILVEQLLLKNFDVTVVDNFMFGQKSVNHLLYNKNFNVFKNDIRNLNFLKSIIKKFDIIIPLAGYVGAPICKKFPKESEDVNKKSLISLVKKLSNDQIVIYPNTNSGYGTTSGNTFCTEETPLNPISLYGKDKMLVENYIMERQNSTCFRLATVFGTSPRMRTDLLVNDFTHKAVNKKKIILYESSFVRNYIHIRDVARAFVFAIENFKKMRGEVFNLGLSGVNLTKKQLCFKIKKYIPSFEIKNNEYKKDIDQRNYKVSNKKIERLKYKTIFSLDDGIIELIKFYRIYPNTFFSNI